ncbi:hypothetical protein HYH03_010649 [Edaphochlamys debaryana]|uniref:Uncharacterized protein n=1 Tax=Edaphochlamys debaryana TaxID=47281 RepID=A0A836BW12_9CHLO|nr:hypothetical protein HYH03_010649 [Edaphochlamys debaryana]|eukprot:KAG2490975.1 hypothetical protein HYH03_010649 [Edaphochlamys debaryana]
MKEHRNETLDHTHSSLDTSAARVALIKKAKLSAQYEDERLQGDGLHSGVSYDKIAAYRGVGMGLYFKILPWITRMMLWMMLCSVPYLIVINTSVFTTPNMAPYNQYGIKVFNSFELASFTFAAIMDEAKDQGLLTEMNTDIAGSWKGPMDKDSFLTWISLVDAGATVVLTAVVVWLFFRVDNWLEKVDDDTREVKDYSILVGGLPKNATATQIGEFFQTHFGEDPKRDKVMDVVLITDLSSVINACKKVNKYEQLKDFVTDIAEKVSVMPGMMSTAAPKPSEPQPAVSESGADADLDHDRPTRVTFADRPTRASAAGDRPTLSRNMSRKLNKADSRITHQKERIAERLAKGNMATKAAFVTFNTEKMRINVCNTMPSGFWAGLFWGKKHRLQANGKTYRIWAKHASAPDDYRFENLATRMRRNVMIQVLTGIVMFCFFLICSAFITWLTSFSNEVAQNPAWNLGKLNASIAKWDNISSTTNYTLSPALVPGVGRRMLSELMQDGGLNTGQNINANDPAIKQAAGICSRALPQECSSTLLTRFGASETLAVNITYGNRWSIRLTGGNPRYEVSNNTLLATLMFEQDVFKGYSSAVKNVGIMDSTEWHNATCLPCYCLGLGTKAADHQFDPAFASFGRFMPYIADMCSDFFDPYDVYQNGVKIAISFGIAIVNGFLGWLLRMLKFFVEKHWTTTDTELSFAMWTFAVKVINTVAILLVVNCSSLSDLQNKAMEGKNGWLKELAFNGWYDDFTPEWYENVGYSIMILMMINVSGPFVRTLIDFGMRIWMRCSLLFLHCGRLATPEDYNTAWRTPPFTLEQRVADLLFNVTLALLFGSGMPLVYLICAVYVFVTHMWDRVALLAIHQPAQRYSPRLVRFVMQMLPVLIVLHCAFGLWMHTYFKCSLDSMGSASSIANNVVDLKQTSRITQPNGLPLLIWFVVMVFWLLFGRWIIWGTVKLLGRGCARLVRVLKIYTFEVDEGSPITYEEALTTAVKKDMLLGARTYRIHHLPAYRNYLSGEAGALWVAAQGLDRYTRLTTFRVHVEVEVGRGEDRHVEQREVEMFDVSPDVIRAVPGPEALASEPLSANVESGELPAHLSGLPSAALQAAALSQVAALEGQTGAIVKRLSMRVSTTTTGLPDLPAFQVLVDGQQVKPAVAAAAVLAARTSATISAKAINIEIMAGGSAAGTSYGGASAFTSAGGAAAAGIAMHNSGAVEQVPPPTQIIGAHSVSSSKIGTGGEGSEPSAPPLSSAPPSAGGASGAVEDPGMPSSAAGQTLQYPVVPGAGSVPEPRAAASLAQTHSSGVYPAVPGLGPVEAAAAYPPVSAAASAAMMSACASGEAPQ